MNMKRLILLLLAISMLLGTAGVALASDISDAIYYGVIRATNSSTLAENVSANVSINSTSLIAAGIMNSTANNTAIRKSGGTDAPFMPGYGNNPWIVWFDSVPENGSVDVTLYTNASNATIYWFPDDDGMAVEDDDTLEPGNYFDILIKAYVDTANGSDKYLIRKGNAFKLYISGDEQVSAAIGGAWEDFEWGNDGDSLSTSGGTVTWTVSATGTSRAEIDTAQKYGGTRSARFYRDGTNSPSAHFSSLAVTNSQEIASRVRKDDTSELLLTHGNGSKRIVVAIRADEKIYYYDGGYQDTGSSVNISTWYLLGIKNVDWTAGTYDIYLNDGQIKSGATMFVDSLFANQIACQNIAGTSECWFDNISVSEAAIVTATNISSGEITVLASANTTHLKIFVDDLVTPKDTDALDGATTANYTDNWTFCEATATPYVESVSCNISGVAVSAWEWEYDTTFHDSIGNNDATPTIRTTCSDADVSASLISFTPVELAEADEDVAEEWPEMMESPPDEPTTAYTEESHPGIFFEPLVDTLCTALNIPESFFWYNFAFIIIIGAGMVTFYFFAEKNTQALLIKIIVMAALMALFALPGPNIYGFYVVIYFAFWSFGVLVLSRSYGW